MAKISTKMDAKASKSKVKKADGELYAEMQGYVDIDIYDADGNFMQTCNDYDISSMYEFDKINEALTRYLNEYPQDFGVAKSKKSMSTPEMIKTLQKMGYTVTKEESEETEEESEETEDGDVDVDVEVEKRSMNFTRKSRTGKSAKSKQSGAEMLKSRGWVKAEDKGPDAEEVEDEAVGSENAVKVPETPEPSDDVEDTEDGVPEIDALEEDGVKTEETGAEEGNDMDALEEDGVTAQEIADMDIDALIEKKRALKEKSEDTPARTQPFSNNYRTVQMGQGKGQVPSGSLGKSTAVKGMVGSRKRI